MHIRNTDVAKKIPLVALCCERAITEKTIYGASCEKYYMQNAEITIAATESTKTKSYARKAQIDINCPISSDE